LEILMTNLDPDVSRWSLTDFYLCRSTNNVLLCFLSW
jgi:hypothetical protein